MEHKAARRQPLTRIATATGLWLVMGAWMPAAAAEPARIASAPPLALPSAVSGAATASAASAPMRLAESAAAAPGAVLQAASEGARDRLAAMRAHNAAANGRPLQNGFARPLPSPLRLRLEGGSAAGAGSAAKSGLRAHQGGLVAASSSGATVWGTRLRVEGASRLRLHLTDLDLPAETRMWVWGSGEEPRGFGLELRGTDGDLWTPSVKGEELFFELELPPGALAAGQEIGFEAPEVMEIFSLVPDGSAAFAAGSATKAGECLLDASCPAAGALDGLDVYRRGVAQLQYVKGGVGLVCSGGLLNDNDDATVIPYLLTASHCISGQASASTLEAFWDYRTAACGGAAPDLDALPRSQGATLLATSSESDFTLLRLHSIPPGRTLLGWTTAPLPDGAKLYRLSHPAPSGAPLVQTFTASTVSEGVQGCAEYSRPKVIYSLPSLGGLYGGSSGAPAIVRGGYVVGQLLGACGPNPAQGCSASNAFIDGAFAVTYAAIRQYLDPAAAVSAGPCVPADDTLCIDGEPGDRRFRVQVAYETAQNGGLKGQGSAVPLASLGVTSGGLFWFFSPTNPEMLIKVLDGCEVNGRYWVFHAASTNLGLTTLVTDTLTGASKTYTNPDLTPARPVQDADGLPCQ